MNILVTGAGGFIGSHLCMELLQQHPHDTVLGVDRNMKTRNTTLLKNDRFTSIELDLLTCDLSDLIHNVDVIYHLAGIPGVRSSWGKDFETYLLHNALLTQNLLDACKSQSIKKFIYISTSSVYGEKSGSVSEQLRPIPLSPYGITKLTGEHLCRVYHQYYGIPVVILRYFTVYGPRQRTDMAFHRFIKQLLLDQPLTVYGDGHQTRDFTYVKDCVKATAAVCRAQDVIGETINIGGKERASVLEIIQLLEQLMNKKAQVTFTKKAKGEPLQTWADITKAQTLLNYQPQISLKEGLRYEIEDLKELYLSGRDSL
ncbi:NAD-dependent epimerase/dehydratase family protein [Bacillus sp. RAR_GA_16]|uniref:NAD-dependent epimerase/dehydratase family protein n=1 Tax=Bacillus sp. RAR_GA_16 TaxID=2876774 RepID=UPI001CCC7921|nr:NAD-dependent epimerase/dehydratase family protein [Bacillus sp. RAR_GA_16]MCA0172269.1 NAD-dependent epimerase/dehydratase family protein [Bacillus sp. RAR_GA_16]